MLTFARRFARDEAGATAIEYGLIVALIAVVIISAVTTLGKNLSTAFNKDCRRRSQDVTIWSCGFSAMTLPSRSNVTRL